MKKVFKEFHLNKNSKRLLVFSIFGALTLGSASTTILFMQTQSNTDSTINNGDTDGSNTDSIDPIKNKLFENLTAANLDINNLKINVNGVFNETSSLTLSFTGGANYLSFMQNATNNLSVNVNDVTAKFGGNTNILIKDTALKNDTTMLNEDLKVYTAGDGTIYFDWNETGYKVSGKFITNTLKAITLFLTDEQNKSLNEILEKIQQIDILTILPMVGTIGGSLVSQSSDLENGGKRYTISIPGSLISETLTSDIVINLDANSNGELTNLSLENFTLPVDGRNITFSISTDSITMQGVNSGEITNELDGYKDGLVSNTSIEEYYSNDLDSTPNLIYTVARMMNETSFKFNYELGFNEYEYKEDASYYDDKLGEINSKASHSFNGNLAADFTNGFENGNYNFTLNKNDNFANDISVQYQANQDENSAKGLFINLNNRTKGYLSDASINDLFACFNNLTSSTDVNDAFSGANDILNDSVIGDIINGHWYRYKDILKKIEIKNDTNNTVTLKISVTLGGLNLNIPFAFESTPVEININYSATDSIENNLINYVEIKNIPLRKVSRLENEVTKSYLDTASIKLNLVGDSIGKNNINVVNKDNLNEYVDYKATIPLFDSIANIVNTKKFNSNYTLTYNSKDYGAISFDGNIAADLSNASFDSSLDDKNYGKYRLTAHSIINDIRHNIQLDYLPNDKTNDQTLYFDYYSQNENYRTRLSLNTETMTSMFSAISTLIANSSDSTGNEETVDGLNEDIFGNLSDTLSSFTDFVNGDIWSLLKSELPDDKVHISNTEKGYLSIKLDLSVFDSSLANGTINVLLSETSSSFAAIDVDFAIPNTSDSVSFSFSFDKYTDSSTGIDPTLIEKYKETDSTVNAILDILTGNFLNAFKLGGFVSNKRQSPRL